MPGRFDRFLAVALMTSRPFPEGHAGQGLEGQEAVRRQRNAGSLRPKWQWVMKVIEQGDWANEIGRWSGILQGGSHGAPITIVFHSSIRARHGPDLTRPPVRRPRHPHRTGPFHHRRPTDGRSRGPDPRVPVCHRTRLQEPGTGVAQSDQYSRQRHHHYDQVAGLNPRTIHHSSSIAT